MTVATLAPATSSAATKVIATSIPQANNIFRLLRILDLFEQSTDSVAVDALADNQAQCMRRGIQVITTIANFGKHVRQGNALTLTEKGRELHALRADMPALCSALLVVLGDNPYFKALEDDWTPEAIASIVAKDEKLSTTTALRRVSTFQSWRLDLLAGVQRDIRKVLRARKHAVSDGTMARVGKGWDTAKELFTTRSVDVRNFQTAYREALLQYYNGQCVLTGVGLRSLLVASHIKPVRDCSAKEAVDPCNGLLLEARFDRLFDQGLISFKGDGTLLVSKTLEAEKAALGIVDGMKLAGVHDATKTYLAYHRAHVFVDRKN